MIARLASHRLLLTLAFSVAVAALTLFVSRLSGFSLLFRPPLYVGSGGSRGRS